MTIRFIFRLQKQRIIYSEKTPPAQYIFEQEELYISMN